MVALQRECRRERWTGGDVADQSGVASECQKESSEGDITSSQEFLIKAIVLNRIGAHDQVDLVGDVIILVGVHDCEKEKVCRETLLEGRKTKGAGAPDARASAELFTSPKNNDAHSSPGVDI